MALFTSEKIVNAFIRIPLAAFFIHHFSHYLFSLATLKKLIEIFTTNPYFQRENFIAKDLAKLQKMSKFWPPQEGFGYGEFSILFTISLVLHLSYISIPTVLQSIFGTSYLKSNSTSSILLNFLVTPLYAAVIPTVLLLPMMRLAEMHIFVLVLNSVHIIICCYIAYFVWFIFRKNNQETEEKKEKTE